MEGFIIYAVVVIGLGPLGYYFLDRRFKKKYPGD